MTAGSSQHFGARCDARHCRLAVSHVVGYLPGHVDDALVGVQDAADLDEPSRWAGVQDERREGAPYGAGQLRRALRFYIEGALARRLGVMLAPAALPDPASSGGTSQSDGRCHLVGCDHDRDPDAPRRL